MAKCLSAMNIFAYSIILLDILYNTGLGSGLPLSIETTQGQLVYIIIFYFFFMFFYLLICFIFQRIKHEFIYTIMHSMCDVSQFMSEMLAPTLFIPSKHWVDEIIDSDSMVTKFWRECYNCYTGD